MGTLVVPQVIYIPPREIVKVGKDRWIIYLPRDHNDVWEEIKKRGLKVRVYLEIVESQREQGK